jgi:uncharacterized protein (DUF58 family)
MEGTDIISKVRKVEIRAKGLMNHILEGGYHSAFRGKGMTFSEVRAYQYGDDIRNIDWNVTARTGDPYVKIFEEERELTIMLLIDVSASQFFGTCRQTKQELATEIAALLSLSAISNNDRVGAILFTEGVEKYIPPQKGRRALLHIIRSIYQCAPSQKTTRIDVALDFLAHIQRKRCVAFLLSDFMSAPFQRSLSLLARRHDVIGLALVDAFERKLPSAGLIFAVDAETGQSAYIDTSDADTVRYVARQGQIRFDSLSAVFASAGADCLRVHTEEDYAVLLHSFFRKRVKRR